jgi:hypothetical protein
MCQSLKEPISIDPTLASDGEKGMDSIGRKSSGKMLLRLPDTVTVKLLKQFGKKFREKAREVKMWRELFQVDLLTVNGVVAWNENQRSNMLHVSNKRKKR